RWSRNLSSASTRRTLRTHRGRKPQHRDVVPRRDQVQPGEKKAPEPSTDLLSSMGPMRFVSGGGMTSEPAFLAPHGRWLHGAGAGRHSGVVCAVPDVLDYGAVPTRVFPLALRAAL